MHGFFHLFPYQRFLQEFQIVFSTQTNDNEPRKLYVIISRFSDKLHMKVNIVERHTLYIEDESYMILHSWPYDKTVEGIVLGINANESTKMVSCTIILNYYFVTAPEKPVPIPS